MSTALPAIARDARRAAERGGLRMAGAMVLAGILSGASTAIVPIFFVLRALGHALERAETGERDAARADASFAAGLVAFCGLLPFLGSMCIAIWVLMWWPETDEPVGIPGWALALQLTACVLGTAAVAPVLAAAPLRITRCDSLRGALGTSIAIAASRPLATALVGAVQGLLFSLPVLGLGLIRGPVALVVAVTGSILAWSAFPPLCVGLAAPSVAPPGSLRALATPTFVALAASGLSWLAVPPPAWMVAPTHGLGLASAVPYHHTTSYAVTLHDDDGRDADVVRCPALRACTGGVSELSDAGTRRLVLDGHPRLVIPVDARGRRLDDTFVARITARADAGLALLLAIAALALGMAIWTTRSARRALRGVANTVPVVLRCAAGAGLTLDDDQLTVRGDAWLERRDADGVLRLDRAIACLAPAELRDGAALFLVTDERAPLFGPREGAASLPADAWLSALDDVDRVHAEHVARAAAFPLVAALLTALLAGAYAVCLL